MIRKDIEFEFAAVQHMIKEGFSENDILGVIQSGRLLENYDEEQRCLILGSFASGEPGVIPLKSFVTTPTTTSPIS